MNKYTDKWTREKFLEYRKLKRNGYTHEMLKEYFGEDIYESGIYSRKSSILPWLNFITEIIVTPKYSNYSVSEKPSDIYNGKFDYIIDFEDNDTKYIISLFYYMVDNIETYNILLTTEEQWDRYVNRIDQIRYKGYITDEERIELVDIVEKETGYNQLYSILKKVSYILLDFIKDGMIISLGETNNLVKINLYRNIIKSSFPNIIDIGFKFDNKNKYFLYQIN